MKKILTFFLVIFVIMIFFTFVFYFVNMNTEDFPHYKQAYYKIDGTIYTELNEKVKIPLFFADSCKTSEMCCKDNIKSINIVDAEGEKLDIKQWDLKQICECDECIVRCIDVETSLNEDCVVEPKKLEIVYKDDYKKEFEFGNFKLVCKKDIRKNNPCLLCNPIHLGIYNDSNKRIITGLAMHLTYIKSKSNFKIENKIIDINLGIHNLGIDKKNIRTMESYITDDINIITYMDKKLDEGDKWPNAFKKINVVDKLNFNSGTIPFNTHSANNEGRTKGTWIFIPVTRLENKSNYNVIYTNFIIKLDIAGKEQIFVDNDEFCIVPNFHQCHEDLFLDFIKENGI